MNEIFTKYTNKYIKIAINIIIQQENWSGMIH